MNWWAVLFSFSGRINRVKYWLGVLLFYLLIFAALFIYAVGNDGVLVLLLPAFWIHSAIAVKRVHDLNRSGWWVIPWLLIPGGQLLLGVLEGTPGVNDYGASPLSDWQAA